jgi:hypothetical protein
MNTRLLIAVVVLVGLGAAVFATLRSHDTSTPVETAALPTLPKIKKEEVTAIEIVKPDKVTIALAKQGDAWALTAPVAAKADQSAVDSVIEKLTELEVSGVAASRKENHKLLQVDAETGIHVKAKGQGDKVLLDMWIGEAKSGGTMVRAEGKDEVLATKGSIRYAFDKEVKLFRDRVITDLEPKDLTAVSIVSAKGKFKFEKPADKWQQAKGEKAIDKFAEAKVNSLVSSAAKLRAADFAEPNETDDHALGFDAPASTVVLTGKDGKETTLLVGREHGSGREYYLRVVGNPVNYRVSKFTAERFMPEAKAFQEEEKKPGAEAPPMGGMPGMGGPQAMGGEQQIPPEILKQLQQQMGQGGGHP